MIISFQYFVDWKEMDTFATIMKCREHDGKTSSHHKSAIGKSIA